MISRNSFTEQDKLYLFGNDEQADGTSNDEFLENFEHIVNYVSI